MYASFVRRRLALLAVALFAAACEGSTLSDRFADIETDAAEYAAGDAVEVTITNVSDVTIVGNPCPWELQRRTAGGWETAAGNSLCVGVMEYLEPGESLTTQVLIPNGIEDGSYRVHFPAVAPEGDESVPDALQSSDPFTVRAPQAL
jgi:hypothetical protein